MKNKKSFIFIFLITSSLIAQQILWSNITSKYSLPIGIQIYEGTRQSPFLKIFYVDADLSNPSLSIRPYISSNNYSVDNFNNKVGAYVSINGGYFGGSDAYSAVIYPDEVKAVNISVVSRNAKTYPVIRSLFSMKEDKTFSVDWIYHFGNTLNDIYRFTTPLPYVNNDPNPLPTPLQTNGEKLTNLLTGIGGAPVLIKKGIISITYNEEIMWGSGVGYDNRDPRSAAGYKNNKHVILLVADGRGTQSEGVNLPELAQIMLDLGCYEAINLDGGGSTQLAVGKSYINTPAGIRPVPAILSIVHSDSVKSNSKPLFEKIIDTEDNSVLKIGNWFETANSGYYGNSKSLLIAKGNGSNFIKYRLNLPAEKKYEVYAWWVAASNRCTNTPYIINHKNKTDTIRVDQTLNGSSWQKLGSFTFTADTNATIKITDSATIGTYVTADAIRIISNENVTAIDGDNSEIPLTFSLSQNYPNPFNPTTKIKFGLPENAFTKLTIFDILGRLVKTLVNSELNAGYHEVIFDGRNLTSGIYFYNLHTEDFTETRKMILIK